MKQEYKKKDTFFRNWGAVFILVAFFLVSWAGQFANQMAVQRQESEQHGQVFEIDEFWPQFWASTFENWQSEWLQLATQALLISGFAAVLFRKQDEEHYKTQLMIEQLRNELKKK
ncbi:hypothetical protein D3C85_983810 [compost metagenome]